MKKETERLAIEFSNCVLIDAIPSINDIERAAHHMRYLQSRIDELEKGAARSRSAEYEPDAYHIEVRRGDYMVHVKLPVREFELCKAKELMARDAVMAALPTRDFLCHLIQCKHGHKTQISSRNPHEQGCGG